LKNKLPGLQWLLLRFVRPWRSSGLVFWCDPLWCCAGGRAMGLKSGGFN